MKFSHELFFIFLNFCAKFEIKKRRVFLICILPIFSILHYRKSNLQKYVRFSAEVLGINIKHSSSILRSALTHLYLMTVDARSFKARGKQKITTDFNIFHVENGQYIEAINQINKTVIIATFHSASYFLSMGYLSAIKLQNKRILFFKQSKPSPTEEQLISGLVNAGIDCRVFVLNENKRITYDFIKSINEVPSVLFHMCDIPPSTSRSLNVSWLGKIQPVSRGIIDLARLLNATIFVATYQITHNCDLIKLHCPVTDQECRQCPTSSLQKIMSYGEKQIRKTPAQWQLWRDWSNASKY